MEGVGTMVIDIGWRGAGGSVVVFDFGVGAMVFVWRCVVCWMLTFWGELSTTT